EKTVLQKLFVSSSYISKTLSVKPVFEGSIPEGFELIKSAVKVYPESILVIGPERVLIQEDSILTKPIDLSEHTKTKLIDVELEDIDSDVRMQKVKVQVSIEIVKTVPNKEKVSK
ncbi:MAG: YbbR-like domain-containing protein, partial [Candidatus Omnitrophota bacterium]